MLPLLVVIFVVAYAAIALEHSIGVNKSASALIATGLLWTVYATMSGNHDLVDEDLTESLAATAQIVFFLMGAMTIVEVVDAERPRATPKVNCKALPRPLAWRGVSGTPCGRRSGGAKWQPCSIC